jgi:hypothetical protein|tara:strand:- start:1121 stop:1336 length:216 start_codon:yes stop_codon:yes gene_type:complete
MKALKDVLIVSAIIMCLSISYKVLTYKSYQVSTYGKIVTVVDQSNGNIYYGYNDGKVTKVNFVSKTDSRWK